MTSSALVFSLVSSHGSASHELVKLCSASGSSFAAMNALAISEKRVNGLYSVFIQNATLRATRAVLRTSRHSPFLSISIFSASFRTAPHAWHT